MCQTEIMTQRNASALLPNYFIVQCGIHIYSNNPILNQLYDEKVSCTMYD